MKVLYQKQFKLTAKLILFWVFAANLYIVVRYIGHVSPLNNPFDQSAVLNYTMFFKLATLGGLFIGLLHGLLEAGFENHRFRRMSYGKLILLKSIFYVFIFILSFAAITILNFIITLGTFDFKVWSEKIFSSRLMVPVVYMSVVTFLINFIRQVSLKFGPGNLWKMLTGTFYRPKEENRIFMFLDLKSSTSIAEKLGHVRYSRLLQDCFSELYVVAQNDAEVYQYVGDEVVLSWPIAKGLKDNNCIKAYFNFTKGLASKGTYYQTEYGTEPAFKAGLNVGKVTVAEVGEIKREIAFHGDTLNTASRIQHLCREMDKKLLISEGLANMLHFSQDFIVRPIGKIPLRGKVEDIMVFSVEENKLDLSSEKLAPETIF